MLVELFVLFFWLVPKKDQLHPLSILCLKKTLIKSNPPAPLRHLLHLLPDTSNGYNIDIDIDIDIDVGVGIYKSGH